MDYFRAAFGGFDPQNDKDAALKLSLDALFADARLDDLGAILSPEGRVGGIEGEPGWILERRLDSDNASYEGWPSAATFRASVDPETYSLGHPEFFCDALTFRKYTSAILKVFAERYPEDSARTFSLRNLLEDL